MSTLLLGGTGFLGSRVAKRLVERGESVVCLDIAPNEPAVATLGERAMVRQGDVTMIEDILAAIKEHRVRRIVNLAYVLYAESNLHPYASVRVNTLGAANVLEAARLMDVERLVYASSITVYGSQSLYGERAVTEDDVAAPISLYGAAKLLNEHQAAIYRKSLGLSVVGIRVGILFGLGMVRGQGVWAGTFASNPAVGKPAAIPYPPDAQLSMIYVDDVAELIARVLFADAPASAIYNSGGDSVRVGLLVEIVRRHVASAEFTFGAVRPRAPYLVDGARAEAEFQWVRPSLADRVRDNIDEARRTASMAA